MAVAFSGNLHNTIFNSVTTTIWGGLKRVFIHSATLILSAADLDRGEVYRVPMMTPRLSMAADGVVNRARLMFLFSSTKIAPVVDLIGGN